VRLLAQHVEVTARQRNILGRLIRAAKTPQRLVERAQIVLRAADGHSNEQLVRELGVTRPTLRKWRRRWMQAAPSLCAAEAQEDDRALSRRIVEALSDAPRSGRPPEFEPEQILEIIATACEDPQDSGLAVSHWTAKDLAQEAMARDIVKQISTRTVARFLGQCDLKPHRWRYWFIRRADHDEAFDAATREVSQVYAQAQSLHAQGVHVVCIDEKTGIQALERMAPALLPIPGFIERQDAHYIRHGTCTLIPTLEVATGQILAPTIGRTRTEADFVKHIEDTVALDPQAPWIMVVDNLNTHVSASLVRFVAKHCGLVVGLGKKGVRGILKSRSTRAEFLRDASHRIRFVFTPKRASWLNQAEIWFSILRRRLLRRGSFVSLEQLRERILAFIESFNAALAKPFKWTYQGRPLAA
jgi:transposase